MRVINADVLFSSLHDRMEDAEAWVTRAETDELKARAEGFLSALIEVKTSVEDEVTTVEAEHVKYGRWVRDGIDKWRCSVCGVGDNYAYAWGVGGAKLQDNYCPNCGAKMEGE